MAAKAIVPILEKSMVATDKTIPIDGMLSNVIIKKWYVVFANTMGKTMHDTPGKI